MKVYVYPRAHQSNASGISLEFSRILAAISNSSYYTETPENACLFIPNIDLLDPRKVERQTIEKSLWALPEFRRLSGANHLLLSFALPYSSPTVSPSDSPISSSPTSSHFGFNIGNALVASGGFDITRYQSNFDIPLPTYSIYSRLYEDEHFQLSSAHFPLDELANRQRQFKVISPQASSLSKELLEQLLELETQYKSFTLFGNECQGSSRDVSLSASQLTFATKSSHLQTTYKPHTLCSRRRRLKGRYLDVLHSSRFCLLIPDEGQHSKFTLTLLSDYLMSGCVPIVVIDNLVLPFEEEIDWSRGAIRIWSHQLTYMLDIISSFTPEREAHLRRYGLALWLEYFSTPEAIALKTLDIINARIFPETFQSVFSNHLPLGDSLSAGSDLSPKGTDLNSERLGFTAVILSSGQTESLFKIASLMNRVSKCLKIVIIWNSRESPPKKLPNINVPVEIMKTGNRDINNRFFPFSAIETEAIFSIDEFITGLTVDEIEFAFQTWLQFPDRIVGFPGRLHFRDDENGKWNYDSEWRNELSMVLTGAAFYHRVSHLLAHLLNPH